MPEGGRMREVTGDADYLTRRPSATGIRIGEGSVIVKSGMLLICDGAQNGHPR